MVISLVLSTFLVSVDKIANKFSEGDALRKAVVTQFMNDIQASPADTTKVSVRIISKSDKSEQVQSISLPAPEANKPRYNRDVLVGFMGGLGNKMTNGVQMQFKYHQGNGNVTPKGFNIEGGQLKPVENKDFLK